MASNNAIGTGAIVLSTSADGLASGLNKAAADVQQWGAITNAEMAKVGASPGAVAGVQGWGTRIAGALKGLFAGGSGGMLGAGALGGAVATQLTGLGGALKGCWAPPAGRSGWASAVPSAPRSAGRWAGRSATWPSR